MDLIKEMIKRQKMPWRDKDSSVEAWRNYWFNKNHICGSKGVDGEFYDTSNWINGKEIRVFCMPEVDEKVVPYVKAGIEDLINQIGLDFSVNYYGFDATAVQQVRESVEVNGRINGETLSKVLIAEKMRNPQYDGKPHADVMITDRYLIRGNYYWGEAKFFYGYMVLGLPGRRQTSFDFIRRISKHEASHLFGLGLFYDDHHDKTNVKGYGFIKECNFLQEAPVSFTCDKCIDALIYFWKGIERRTGEKFFNKHKLKDPIKRKLKEEAKIKIVDIDRQIREQLKRG